MIQKANRTSSARVWQLVMESAMDEETFTAIFVNLFKRAKTETAEAVVVRDSLIGRPRLAPVEVSPIEMGDLRTLDGCIDALSGLAHAQNSGQVNEQTAGELRATILGVMQAHRQKQVDTELEALMGDGAVPNYLTPEDHASFLDYRSGRVNRG